MTILGPFLWPYFLIFPPLEQPAKNLFLEAAVLESSSSRKTSWTSVESVALPGLSTLNFCPFCVHLGDLECGPGSLFPSLKGPTVSSGQVAGAGRGGDMGARGGCWGVWHGEPSPLPDGDAETTHRESLAQVMWRC